MKQELEIYVLGQKVDTFKDESITIKKSLKEIKEPTLAKTSISRTITLPASKTNNKLFKHYYRTDLSSGIDGRAFIEAELKVNGVSLEKGYVNIESVSLKDGTPHSYNVRFTGELVLLKKELAGDSLPDLDLSSLDFAWTDANVKAKLSDTTSDLRVGLASINNRLLFHSTDDDFANSFENTRNLSTQTTGAAAIGKSIGVKRLDLRPSIRVGAVLDAIEAKYGFNLYGGIRETQVEDLFLHCFRKDFSSEQTETGFAINTPITNAGNNVLSLFGSTEFIIGGYMDFLRLDNYTMSSSDGSSFTATLMWGDGTIIQSITGTAPDFQDLQLATEHNNRLDTGQNTRIKMQIIGEVGVVYNSNITWKTTARGDKVTDIETESFTSIYEPSGDFRVSEHIPNIKVVDFLSILISKFNLVVSNFSTSSLGVHNINISQYEKYLNDFANYAGDITKYVDSRAVKVSNTNFFSSIEFNYAEPVTNLGKAYNHYNGRSYGSYDYIPTDGDSGLMAGKPHKVKLNAQSLVGEPLNDIATGNYTLSYVHIVDKDLKTTETAPFFHYLKGVTQAINYSTSTDTAESVSSFNTITPYNNSANVILSFSPADVDYSVSPTDSNRGRSGATLLEQFHLETVVDSFNANRRRISLTAYLPYKLILTLRPLDVVEYADNLYRVESIQTNYLTGASKLELITRSEQISTVGEEQAAGSGETGSGTDTSEGTGNDLPDIDDGLAGGGGTGGSNGELVEAPIE